MRAVSFFFAALTCATSARLPRADGCLAGVDSSKPKITFQGDSFKILALSDFHFCEDTWIGGTIEREQSQRLQGRLIDAEKPNFIALIGDIVSGEALNPLSPLQECVTQVLEGPGKRGVKFGLTAGNHDNDIFVTHDMILQAANNSPYQSLSYTRTDAGPAPRGHLNYWLPVYADQDKNMPTLIMWFLDSGGGLLSEERVDVKTVPAWIASQAECMKAEWGEMPPSIVFTHQPFKPAESLSKLAGLKGNSGAIPKTQQGAEAVFDALANLSPRPLVVVSGHVHQLNWCAQGEASRGIALCFAGHSSINGAKTAAYVAGERSGRVLSFSLSKLNNPISYNSYANADKVTWLTLENVTLGEGFRV